MNTTVTLSKELSTFYVRTFLKNSNNLYVYDTGAQKRTIPAGDGKAIHFSRYNPLAAATTPLTEGDSGTGISLQEVEVTATIQEFGQYAKMSRLLSDTSIDLNAKAKIELFRDQLRLTQDTIVRDELMTNSTLISSTATNLTADLIKSAVRKLKTNKAFTFSDGYFIGIIDEFAAKDLMADSKWLDPKSYKDTLGIYKGEIGAFYGVRFIQTNNGKIVAPTTSAAGTCSTLIYGRESFGTVDLEKDKPRLLINGNDIKSGEKTTFTRGDKSDPLARFDTLGWVAPFAAKVLNSNWIMSIATTASDLAKLSA